MRRDVLELMAEEIAGRPVDALASFTSWDDGRRKLDGMVKGKRWDIDHEHRDLERDTQREVKRLMKLRCRTKKRALYRATAAAYEKKWKGRKRLLRLRRYKATAKAQAAKLRAYRLKSGYTKGKLKCGSCRQPGHNARSCRGAR